jgi:CheY-like chemotaxis protein
MPARVILYMEDDDAAFSLAKIVLEEEPDIVLLRASDGEQGLAILRNFPPYEETPRPDLILLDVNLPKRSGLELLADLKASEPLRSIPVVMFSTSEYQEHRHEAARLGAKAYVDKPLGFEAFVTAVKKACALTPRSSTEES